MQKGHKAHNTFLSTHGLKDGTVGIALTSPYGKFTLLAREGGTILEVRNAQNEELGTWRLRDTGAVRMKKASPRKGD